MVSFTSYANEKNQEIMYDDIDAGSVSKVNDIKSSSSSISNFSLLDKSFYLDMKSKVGLPNIKLEYTNNTYSTKLNDINNNYINNQPNFIDLNLQYGDIVSYYTLYSPIENLGFNLGAGLRQYIGNIEYQDNNEIEKESLNSTIPLTYIDTFYNIGDRSQFVGLYTKESQLKNEKIQESGIYYKKKLTGIDNLNFTASYSISSISFSNSYNTRNDAGLESNGLNFQLRLAY